MGLFGGLFGKKAAKKNQKAALELAQKAQWQPTGLDVGGNTVSWNGTNASAQVNPLQQALAFSMLGQGQDWLGKLNGMGQVNPVTMSSQLDPFLSSQMNSANGAYQGLDSSQYNTSALGGQLGEAASGFLGSLGSFDPAQLAAQYTDLLRQGAQPGEQRAANNALSSLYATGRLGTTGGAQQYGELALAQQQADIQRQLAGMQFGGQEQNRLAGLAGNFAGMADQFAGSNFARDAGSAQFNNDRTTQRFLNAMQLFGASNQQNAQQADVGLQNNQQQLAQQGLFGQLGMGFTGMGLDQNNSNQMQLLNLLGASGNLSQARSGTQLQAWTPYYNATVARNNAGSGFFGKLLDAGLGAWTGGNIWGP